MHSAQWKAISDTYIHGVFDHLSFNVHSIVPSSCIMLIFYKMDFIVQKSCFYIDVTYIITISIYAGTFKEISSDSTSG